MNSLTPVSIEELLYIKDILANIQIEIEDLFRQHQSDAEAPSKCPQKRDAVSLMHAIRESGLMTDQETITVRTSGSDYLISFS